MSADFIFLISSAKIRWISGIRGPFFDKKIWLGHPGHISLS